MLRPWFGRMSSISHDKPATKVYCTYNGQKLFGIPKRRRATSRPSGEMESNAFAQWRAKNTSEPCFATQVRSNKARLATNKASAQPRPVRKPNCVGQILAFAQTCDLLSLSLSPRLLTDAMSLVLKAVVGVVLGVVLGMPRPPAPVPGVAARGWSQPATCK